MYKFGIFRKPMINVIPGRVVELRKEREYPQSRFRSYTSIEYGIYMRHTDTRVGYCDLRIGDSEELYYAGDVGYRIDEAYRGNGYAFEACRVLFQIAKDEYNLTSLQITCSPDNIASRKTLEKLGGVLLDCVDVPDWHWLYRRGETKKNIYSFTL